LVEFFSNEDIDAIQGDPEQNFFTPVLKTVIEKMGNVKKICDVGCGNGVFTAILKDWNNCELIGVDGSQYALKLAKNYKFDGLFFIKDFSNDKLPFEDNSFDLVISKDVLEHLFDPLNLATEISRILKNDTGRALIHVPNHFHIYGRLKLLFNNSIDSYNYFPNSNRWDFPHIRFFNNEDFLRMFESVGLSPILNLSYHFHSIPFINRFLPKQIKSHLATAYPNMFAEGFTYLFKK
tara:strand:+ start:1197 stop:1904 length:708 start_codon:yes stop_codon:yes gene_type:complete